jgi:hypothetical protein
MSVSSYSIILGRDWQDLTGRYISLDETHLYVPQNGNNIIVLRKGTILLYIKSFPQPNVNYLEEYFGVYSIFVDEGDTILEPIDLDEWHMHFDGSC